VAHGERVFWGKGECGQCHRVGARGGLLGPNLSNLAAQMRLSEVRSSLTTPKPHPPRGFQPVTAVTKDGRTIRGVLKNQHNFSLQILGDDDKLHLLVPEEIASLQRPDASIMPADVDKRLTAEEFQDLLAYLSRLREPRP
jgi:putative heme-binding domain-containing protein